MGDARVEAGEYAVGSSAVSARAFTVSHPGWGKTGGFACCLGQVLGAVSEAFWVVCSLTQSLCWRGTLIRWCWVLLMLVQAARLSIPVEC